MHILSTLRRRVLAAAARLRVLPPLLARLGVGLAFVQTGWGKLHSLDQVTDYFRSLGIPFAAVQAPFVAALELVCGALLIVGLATRGAAMMLIGTMVVAIATAILPDVAGVGELFGTIEALYVVIFLYLAVGGAGRLSLDTLVARRLDRIDET